MGPGWATWDVAEQLHQAARLQEGHCAPVVLHQPLQVGLHVRRALHEVQVVLHPVLILHSNGVMLPLQARPRKSWALAIKKSF